MPKQIKPRTNIDVIQTRKSIKTFVNNYMNDLMKNQTKTSLIDKYNNKSTL